MSQYLSFINSGQACVEVKLNISSPCASMILNDLDTNGRNQEAQNKLYSGKPMETKEFHKVEQQLQTDLDANLLWKTTDFASGEFRFSLSH